jgi:raffinose/stachyose/melibiose transport system permease protein/N-acetylglucosamine transport system permease protein
MKTRIRKTAASKIVFAVVFALFLLYAAGLLLPFAYGLSISLKENGRAFMRDPVSLPFPPFFSNYAKAFRELEIADRNLLMMTLNSVWYAGGAAFLGILASACVAYVVAKYRFKGRNFIYGAALVVMMIPIYGALPAQYRLYTRLGIVDSPFILIASFYGFGVYFIYIHAFFKSLSWHFAEAAFIDGAGHFRVFLTVMLPQMLPAVSALFVMQFIAVWNDYASAILWLPNRPTLASGLFNYEFNARYAANQPVYFAGVVLSLLPVLAIFVALQNTIMTRVYTGGLKG